jgi:hypothetical protein
MSILCIIIFFCLNLFTSFKNKDVMEFSFIYDNFCISYEKLQTHEQLVYRRRLMIKNDDKKFKLIFPA